MRLANAKSGSIWTALRKSFMASGPCMFSSLTTAPLNNWRASSDFVVTGTLPCCSDGPLSEKQSIEKPRHNRSRIPLQRFEDVLDFMGDSPGAVPMSQQ